MSFNERLNYIRDKDRDSVSRKAVDALTILGIGLLTKQNELEAENKKIERTDELFDRNVRLSEVNRLTGIHPDIDPNDFGDPIRNAQDFRKYTSEIKIKTNAMVSASEYNPIGGVVSQEAQRDLFSYGAIRASLDSTATILSREDLFNYDAWLLGGIGTVEGRTIAARHNWAGVLNDYNEDYEGYILDEGDYIDLKDKGLIDVLEPYPGTDLYVLKEEQKTGIIKKYKYWKKGFIATKQPQSRSQISGMITQNNIANQDKLNKLHDMDQYKMAIENINTWRPHSDKSVFDLVDANDEFTTDYIQEDGTLEQESLPKSDFMERFPHTYSWLYTSTNFEQARAKVVSSPALLNELKLMPKVEARFSQQMQDWNNIEAGKRNLGITNTQDEWIIDSRIMGDARNMVLDDLQAIGNGILFNDVALDELAADPATSGQIDDYIKQLKDLEQGYITQGSMHYNPDVERFLSLYGFGANMPGVTLDSVL